MSSKVIILAGCPGTGKSYLANKIIERYNDFSVLGFDDIKEGIYDLYGFNNLDEKEILTKKTWDIYYKRITEMLMQNKNIILDYPFSYKQKDILKNIFAKFHSEVLTIRLIGDMEVLYKRRISRDLDSTRHIGHLLDMYHQGKRLSYDQREKALITKEAFYEICNDRQYANFCIGSLIEVDVTEYQNIDYVSILQSVYIFYNSSLQGEK